ncbi:MAG: hypothetical protein ABJO02_09735 [Reichenbachiella sp.]|uniref:hypothetical protein n=1 Tax=Reichenbachiella sp. TaxID=2184521 RepID=UPI0032986140
MATKPTFSVDKNLKRSAFNVKVDSTTLKNMNHLNDFGIPFFGPEQEFDTTIFGSIAD